MFVQKSNISHPHKIFRNKLLKLHPAHILAIKYKKGLKWFTSIIKRRRKGSSPAFKILYSIRNFTYNWRTEVCKFLKYNSYSRPKCTSILHATVLYWYMSRGAYIGCGTAPIKILTVIFPRFFQRGCVILLWIFFWSIQPRKLQIKSAPTPHLHMHQQIRCHPNITLPPSHRGSADYSQPHPDSFGYFLIWIGLQRMRNEVSASHG